MPEEVAKNVVPMMAVGLADPAAAKIATVVAGIN